MYYPQIMENNQKIVCSNIWKVFGPNEKKVLQDLDTSLSRDKLILNMEKEGALILGCGHKSVRFRPHLNISKKEINIACDMLIKSIKKL